MQARVNEKGVIFRYGSNTLRLTRNQGLERVKWCRQEVGEHNVKWGIWYFDFGSQWWFLEQEDLVRFTLTWC